MHSLNLARFHCFPNQTLVPYVALMDDDYLVNVDNLLDVLEKHPPNEQLYAGWRIESTPFRLVFQKFHVGVGKCFGNVFNL